MVQMGRRSFFLFCLIGALAIALAILAVLEYRWAGIVSEANRERMQTRLHTAVSEIQAEFNRDILDLSLALEPALPTSPGEWRRYAQGFAAWRRKSRYPGIAANVYTFRFTPAGKTIRKWNPATADFAPTDRPVPPFAALSGTSPTRTGPVLLIETNNAPVLIQTQAFGSVRNIVVVELSLDTLRRDVFPDLIHRYLGDDRLAEFQIGVLARTLPQSVGPSFQPASAPPGGVSFIYQSDPNLSPASFLQTDESLLLLRHDQPGSPLTQNSAAWELVAKHRQGSLASAASEARRRWLIINFAVLIILALGLVTIVTSIWRAQTFLRLQMEFVAGVSHELRTPLSVIGSAADNLAEGVVRSEKDVQEYGSLILSECRRLSGLVEQTLRFSASKADVRSREIQFFHITDVIDRALSAAVTATDGNSFSLEKIVDPDLPMVRADLNLLSECLLNLISNALKYGGDAQWLGIRAHTVETGHGTGVQITIEDRGIGIPCAELRHVFEPFYRGQTARSAQIRGTGLGLSLAREAANSMGARITVESTVGKGSAFTLHIPPAYMNSSTVPVEALVES
jgi:signal transduction histidine kinase